jgi:hypothetical protein
MTTEPKPDCGKAWRVLAHDGARTVEVQNQGTFDELVVDDWLHVEQMDDEVWWLRIGDARVMVTLGPAEPSVDVERGFYSAVSGSTKIRD